MGESPSNSSRLLPRLRFLLIALPVALSLLAAAPVGADVTDEVSFRTDVMAVLSKGGCNMGACHGNKNGKGGFKLSLRGEDPTADISVLSREVDGRRINSLEPDGSLLLLKATMQLPHQGGRRFAVDSLEYRLLRRWIADGARADRQTSPTLVRLEVEPRDVVLVEPADGVALQVEAQFSDGSRRDVKQLAVYEASNPLAAIDHDGRIRRESFGTSTVIVRYLDRQVPVRVAFVPARPNFVWNGPAPLNFIDELVFSRLRELKINPAPTASDTVFLRRAYLDLLGILPTAAESKRFINESRADKRARLIDELLDRPEFADAWALKWADLLRVEEKTLDRKGVQGFYAWIRAGIAADKPLDQFARELIAARGSTYRDPASNYYRAMREPFMRAESTAQVFLGIRLQCSKCHNHPFDRWTQDDYYDWANLFARVEYKVLENRRRDTNDSHEFDGEQIVVMARQGDVKNARTDLPARARLLGSGSEPLPPSADRLQELAEWLGSSTNKLFVETQANRIWFHLLGQGIVDPIDDFRATNPPSNPALLEALSAELVSSRFSLRHLIRTIMNSRVYQLSSAQNDTNRDDDLNFSRARGQLLTAEQRADAMSQVAAAPLRFASYPDGFRAGELPGVSVPRDRESRPTLADDYLRESGKPPRLQSCECERSSEPTLSQTMRNVSGPFVLDLLGRRNNRLDRMLKEEKSTDDMVDELYWSALSRPPTAEERSAFVTHVDSQSNRRNGLEDVLWALMNSKEFLFRR